MSDASRAEDEPKKVGRPSIKSPELMEEICQRIASGRSVKNICEDEDMPSFGFVWRWINEDAVFEHRYARAIQQRALHHADEITQISQKVMQGQLPPDAARVAIDAMKWTASRLLPKVYGDKQIVEANVTHTHQLHLDALKALTSRRSGNEIGSHQPQVIEAVEVPTFHGERLDAPAAAEVSYRVVEDAEDPPVSPHGGGAASASATSPHTGEKPSDPPPPTPRKARKPRAPKKSKKQDGEK